LLKKNLLNHHFRSWNPSGFTRAAQVAQQFRCLL